MLTPRSACCAFSTLHQVSFLDEGILSYRSVWFALERGADALFTVDILVNLNRAVLSPDGSRLVTSRWDIFKHYLRHGLILDCAASIPWDLVAQAAWSRSGAVGVGRDPAHGTPNAQRLKAVRLIRLLQLLRLEHVLDGPRRWGSWVRDHLGMSYAVMQLVSFLSGCVLIGHWLACLFHFTALVEPGECNWVNLYANSIVGLTGCLQLPGVPPLSIGSRYIIALYWSVQTITTVGYGDVSPTTDAERCVVIACVTIGAGMYAFVVGSVCGVVAQMTTRDVALEEVLDASARLANPQLSGDTPTARAALDADLLRRMRQYMRYVHGRGAAWAETDMHVLLPNLSPQLTQELFHARRGASLRACRLFWNAPEAAMRQLSMTFSLVTFCPQEAIHVEGLPVETLVLLRHGMVLTLSNVPAQMRHILMTGVRHRYVGKHHPQLMTPVLGMECLWSLNKASVTTASLTFTEALVVRKEQLHGLLEGHLQDQFMCVRTRSMACLLTETIRQMGVARRAMLRQSKVFEAAQTDYRARLRAALASGSADAVAAALVERPELSIHTLLSDSMRGTLHTSTLPQLTPALLMDVCRATCPKQWHRVVSAAALIQRTWRRRAVKPARREPEPEPQTPRMEPRPARLSGAHQLAPARLPVNTYTVGTSADVVTLLASLTASVDALRNEVASMRAVNANVLRTATSTLDALIDASS